MRLIGDDDYGRKYADTSLQVKRAWLIIGYGCTKNQLGFVYRVLKSNTY
jgi:hypothetical protein